MSLSGNLSNRPKLYAKRQKYEFNVIGLHGGFVVNDVNYDYNNNLLSIDITIDGQPPRKITRNDTDDISKALFNYNVKEVNVYGGYKSKSKRMPKSKKFKKSKNKRKTIRNKK